MGIPMLSRLKGFFIRQNGLASYMPNIYILKIMFLWYKTLSSFVLIAAFILCCSCGSGEHTQPIVSKDTLLQNYLDKNSDTIHAKYNHLISNIPIPFDILKKLSNSFVLYKHDLLYPINSAAGYNQTDSKSLIIGVYGADMTYSISLGEFKEFAIYIRTIKKLADDLGIPTAFNDTMMDRYDANKDNKDTLQKIIYSSYSEIDRTLKANDRIGMATLVVCGGWVESLFLTSQTIGNNENNGSYADLYSLMLEQKTHLANLIELVDDFKAEPFKGILRDLLLIQKLYTEADDDDHFTKEEVKNISEKVAILRERIVKGN